MNAPLNSSQSYCRFALMKEAGWQCIERAEGTVWFIGYVYDNDRDLGREQVGAKLAALPSNPDALRDALAGIDGQFAAVIVRQDATIAVVDHIASYPLLLDVADGQITIADRALSLGYEGRIAPADLDRDAATVFSMSGFTIGTATLRRTTSWLPAGSFAVIDHDGLRTGRHYIYTAWEAVATPQADLEETLEALLGRMFERTIRALDGRTVLLPLSAGQDSRLIAAGLWKFGYKNVKCFSYGQRGNFEARAARQIAERLNYPWTLVPYRHRMQRTGVGRGGHARYRQFSDTLAAVPFEQDYFALEELERRGLMTNDTVIINGQSGDFITGNHIPAALGPDAADGAGDNWDTIIKALVAKHHSLWASLASPKNLQVVREATIASLRAIGAPERPGRAAYGLYEFIEYCDRQSKYVVGGQRAYDFFGLAWRLPLWERPFVEFWRTVPLEVKYQQRLYRQTLARLNWGNVWNGIDDRRTVAPSWIKPLRAGLKLVAAPLGQKRWHEIERRYLAYWMDIVCNYSSMPFGRVAFDRRGFRNAISWINESYLVRHGLDWTGKSKIK
jgi:asparagine synthase (glutamine-hydrolysing)